MRNLIVMLTCLLCGCASGYRPLKPTSSYFQGSTDYAGLEFSYRMGVLREHHNRKYANKEDKRAIRVVAVKLVNTSGSDLTVGEDFLFYSGDSELKLLDPSMIHSELKQGVPLYLLYLLLSPMQLYSLDENGSVHSTPIGLFIGPGIAFGNMLGAGEANQNFLKELLQFNIINKTIKSGQTVFGLIGIRDTGYSPITIKLINEL
jgi:hypothetical protein